MCFKSLITQHKYKYFNVTSTIDLVQCALYDKMNGTLTEKLTRKLTEVIITLTLTMCFNHFGQHNDMTLVSVIIKIHILNAYIQICSYNHFVQL